MTATCALATACGERPGAVGPTDLPYGPVGGGGTTGGLLRGRAVVYVLAGGVPREGVTVAVDTEDRRWVGTTDQDGQIEFEAPELRGPVTVTAFRNDGPHRTLAGVFAVATTLELTDPSGPEPAEALATGTVRGWPAASVERAAEVRPIVRNLLAPSLDRAQDLRPDGRGAANVVFSPSESYRLRLDPTNAVGVYAISRPLDTTPEYLGLTPDVAFVAGATVAADIDLLIPLDRRVTLTTANRPSLPFVAVLPYLRLQDRGALGLNGGLAVAADALTIHAPMPDAVPDAELRAVAIARDAQGQQSIRWFPLARATTDLPEFLPIPVPTSAGARTTWVFGAAPDIQRWTLLVDGEPAWIMDVVGPARRPPVVWPEPLETFADPVEGSRSLSVVSFAFAGFDPNRFGFDAAEDDLVGLAFAFGTVSF